MAIPHLIVDNDVAHLVFLPCDDVDYAHIRTRLLGASEAGFQIAYCYILAEEYSSNEAVRRILVNLDRMGRAIRADDAAIEAAMGSLRDQDLCRSNDIHIIALAQASGARILCSHDHALHADFKNKRLVDNPRGKVYLNPKHNHLLRPSTWR